MNRNKAIAFLVGVLTVVVCGFVLDAAESVILPLVIAWLLSYILGPVVTGLVRHRVPAGLGITFIVVLLLAACYALAVFLHARISAFAAAYPVYQGQLQKMLMTVTERWQLSWNPFEAVDWGPKVGNYLVTLSGSLVSFVSSLVMVFVFLVFLLLGKPYFGYKVRKAFAEKTAENITVVLASISGQIGRYLAVQFLLSLATGGLVWMSLTLLGVDFAITWGTVAFLLNFIPTIGSIVASIPPVLLALVQYYPDCWRAVAVAVAMLSIQMILGNVVSPKVMGDKLNLSPVVVLLSLVFWGWLWGVAGAIISVPIASTIKIVCENIEPLKPIAIMMGAGRPYQREFQARDHATG
jgi:AI-2 transport protein TqsA